MIPMGYSREINVPSDFLLNFTQDCEERLAVLKERCGQILSTLSAFVEGDGRPVSAFDHGMLKQIIATENAAFLRLAGGKVAPFHDMVSRCWFLSRVRCPQVVAVECCDQIEDLRRDVLDTLRTELHAQLATNTAELARLFGSVTSSQVFRDQLFAAVDPFVAADNEEKKAKEKLAKKRLESLHPKQCVPHGHHHSRPKCVICSR